MTNQTEPAEDPQPGAAGTGPTPAPQGAAAGDGDSTAERAPHGATGSAGSDPDAAGAARAGESDQGSARETAGATTATATASPFAGIPVSDYVRDGVAALLLLVSLALPWDVSSRASDKIEVVLLTILSLLTLALPYLARTGVLPTTWTVHTTRKVRLLANAPYVLLVLVYLVVDVVGGGDLADGWGGSAPPPRSGSRARSSRRSRARASSGRRTRTARSPTGGSRRSSRSRRSSPSPCCSR